MKIITHSGHAHRDEFVAVSLLLGSRARSGQAWATPIERRNPTLEELENPDVLCVDIGERFEVEKGNLDHHQLGRDEPPTCSITQVLRYLGIDLDLAREVWGWLAFSEMIDSKGPGQTAQAFGFDREKMFAAMSPLEAYMIRLFQQEKVIEPGQELHKLMTGFGLSLLDGLTAMKERLELLDTNARVEQIKNLDVLVVDFIDPKESPAMALELWCKKHHIQVAVVVSLDEREPGRSLFRRNDNKKIDFSRIEAAEGVRFAHKNGFVAKVAMEANWRELVAKSVVSIS